ncbi:MAG TPA: TIGR01244 family sulfur transferase [Brevundimonas sp.]|jgi:sulfide:quinone oxidoreductase|uniref:TIGR01244 family sulfur transferase n=1 Tax=Brevundimonas sp. TaxID=1871086 RepID=UPI002E13540F|nr:TIGR01244 family sulfur transferase [Brevundimonas sp.]
MDIRKLEPGLDVTGQILPGDVPALAALGYRAIVSNRPDGEEVGQPRTEDVARAAAGAGLAFRHLPVRGGAITDDDVAAFRDALETLPGPVLGFCRSGMRTTTLWALSRATTTPADTLLTAARAAGYDLEPLRPRLAA